MSFLANRTFQQLSLCSLKSIRSSTIIVFNRSLRKLPSNSINNLNLKPKNIQIKLLNTDKVAQEQVQANIGIFKKFKEAYKKHGTTLIIVHIFTCIGWFAAFYTIAQTGFDITKLFNVLEKLHIISHETSLSIERKIHNFNLEKFLRSWYADYILSDSQLEKLGHYFNGITLKHLITALMLYKLATPLRYLATLGLTKLSIDLLKRRGLIQPPPPGYSVKEIITEQKQQIRRKSLLLKKRKEQYKVRSLRFRDRLLKKKPQNGE